MVALQRGHRSKAVVMPSRLAAWEANSVHTHEAAGAPHDGTGGSAAV